MKHILLFLALLINLASWNCTYSQSIIRITAPNEGFVFDAGFDVFIRAEITDASLSISKVEFYDGSTLVGTDEEEPYETNYVQVGPGGRILTAKAYDLSGNVFTSEPISVRAINNSAIAKVCGKIIGSSSAHNTENTKEHVFDNDRFTYFEGANADDNWVGNNLGREVELTSVKYSPRIEFEERMAGGVIQGSNTPDFSVYTNIASITEIPEPNKLATIPFPEGTIYRYVRYLSPNGSYGNISELEFWGYGSCYGTGSSDTAQSNSIKIMPVGSSICQANPGYKTQLWTLLKDAGYNVDFVGAKMDVNTHYMYHSGFAGYTNGPDKNFKLDQFDPWGAANILFHIDKGYNLSAYDADIWVMDIGINEWFNQKNYDPDILGAVRMDSLISKIFTHNPDLILFVANVTPVTWSDNFANLYNSQIPGLVEKYKNLGYKCYFADLRYGIDWDTRVGYDMSEDQLHPTQRGYDKMGEYYFSVLKPVLDKILLKFD